MIIGLTGPAGSGKSTIAKALGFERRSFALPLKQMMVCLLRHTGMPPAEIERRINGDLKEQVIPIFGKSARSMMQTLGTEWGRDQVHPDMWVKVATANLPTRVVFDDVRFENETVAIRQTGGVIVRLSGRGGIAGSHMSEKGVTADHVVSNTGTVSDTVQAILQAIGTGLQPR